MAMTHLVKWASNVFRLRTTALSDEESGYLLRIPFIIEIRCGGTMGQLIIVCLKKTSSRDIEDT